MKSSRGNGHRMKTLNEGSMDTRAGVTEWLSLLRRNLLDLD